MAIYRDTAGEIIASVEEQFYEDVVQGLSASPKYLKSKYFYDEKGDKLFQQIMESPEYYLTNCELEIFSQQTAGLAGVLMEAYDSFDVVELGAGDATKSKYLLEYLNKQGLDFTYYPVDISDHVIQYLETELPTQLPGLKVRGLNDEYFTSIKKLNELSVNRKLFLFLGANIGNLTPKEARAFLKSLHDQLQPGDLLLTGFDLKKDPRQIRAAYDDAEGVTRAFNLNLLHRINRELQGNIDVNQFDHYASYNPVSGACRSYLISLQQQVVTIGDREFTFEKYEALYMELSQKYSVADTDKLAAGAGFQPVAYFYDSNHWFLDAIWQKQ